jgi:hypothetical protein
VIDAGRGFGRQACVGLALAASAACAPARTVPPAVDPCAAPGVDTTGWKVADAGPFRFSVPNDYQRRTVQGIDSYIGRWSAPGRSVHFDWGPYSSTLDESATLLRGHVECTMEIGGHRAKVVGGFDAEGDWQERGRKYVVAATWREVEPGTHLTLSVTSAAASDVPALLSIVRSVRFQPGTPAR